MKHRKPFVKGTRWLRGINKCNRAMFSLHRQTTIIHMTPKWMKSFYLWFLVLYLCAYRKSICTKRTLGNLPTKFSFLWWPLNIFFPSIIWKISYGGWLCMRRVSFGGFFFPKGILKYKVQQVLRGRPSFLCYYINHVFMGRSAHYINE